MNMHFALIITYHFVFKIYLFCRNNWNKKYMANRSTVFKMCVSISIELLVLNNIIYLSDNLMFLHWAHWVFVLVALLCLHISSLYYYISEASLYSLAIIGVFFSVSSRLKWSFNGSLLDSCPTSVVWFLILRLFLVLPQGYYFIGDSQSNR